MDEESRIISLCQVISHWASQRGQATVWQEQKQFEKYDAELKKRIFELKEFVRFERVK